MAFDDGEDDDFLDFGAAKKRRRQFLSHPDPVVAERRRVADERFGHVGYEPFNERVTDLVDAGKPYDAAVMELAAEIAQVRPVPHGVLAVVEAASGPGCRGLYDAVMLAARIPEAWIPRPSTADGRAFTDFAASMRGFGLPSDDMIQDFVSNCGGEWDAWLSRAMEASAGLPMHHDAEEGDERTVVDLAHAIWALGLAFGNQLVIPAMMRIGESDPFHAKGDGYDVARRMLMGGSTLEDLVAAGRRIFGDEGDANLAAIHEAIPAEHSPTWDPLVPPTALGGGIEVAEINSVRQLLDDAGRGKDAEGVWGMGHARHDLIESCMDGVSHLLSVRKSDDMSDNRRLGTFEVWYTYTPFTGDQKTLVEDDAISVRTRWVGIGLAVRTLSEEDEACEIARDRLVDALVEDRVPLLYDPPREMVECALDFVEAHNRGESYGLVWPRRYQDRPIDEKGHWLAYYPVMAPGAVEAAFEAWRPLVPASLRTASFDEMVEMLKIAVRDEASENFPAFERRHGV